MRRLIMIIFIFALAYQIGVAGDFEPLFEGHGNITSYIYFKQDAEYFIDTELSGTVETFRYKKFRLSVDLFKETHMGRKFNSNMVFDPTRAHWSFGLIGRMEFEKYFLEAQMHHDCFHDIDRWHENSVYWNSPRLGFGTLHYLTKYKYHSTRAVNNSFEFENRWDYYILAGFFAPQGNSFQKGHDYDFTLNTNFRYDVFRYGRLGGDLESDNLWVLNTDGKVKRQHRFSINSTIYGTKGAMVVFLRIWTYDDQSIRNKAHHKFAFGIHFGF